MEAWGFFSSLVGYLGVSISRRLDARETPSCHRLTYPVGGVRGGVGARRRARVAAKKTAGIMLGGLRRSWTRGASSRVDRSSAALGRGLFRHVHSLFFLVFSPSVAPTALGSLRAGFGAHHFDKKASCRPLLAVFALFLSRVDRDNSELQLPRRVHGQITALHT